VGRRGRLGFQPDLEGERDVRRAARVREEKTARFSPGSQCLLYVYMGNDVNALGGAPNLQAVARTWSNYSLLQECGLDPTADVLRWLDLTVQIPSSQRNGRSDLPER
jgi:hypothetical protein